MCLIDNLTPPSCSYSRGSTKFGIDRASGCPQSTATRSMARINPNNEMLGFDLIGKFRDNVDYSGPHDHREGQDSRGPP